MVEENPIIAAVKDFNGLAECCKLEDINIVFILFGDICTIPSIVEKVKAAGKMAMVHIDLISGFSYKEIVVDFIKQNTKADGIITTKPAMVKRGKELSLYTILRFFVIDSMALENIQKLNRQYPDERPDFIEVLPGVMPKIIKKVAKNSKNPLIASGMITAKEDVVQALEAGAISISTTNQDVWRM